MHLATGNLGLLYFGFDRLAADDHQEHSCRHNGNNGEYRGDHVSSQQGAHQSEDDEGAGRSSVGQWMHGVQEFPPSGSGVASHWESLSSQWDRLEEALPGPAQNLVWPQAVNTSGPSLVTTIECSN